LIVPDAQLDDGRVLFLLTPEKLTEAHRQVFLAKLKRPTDEPVSA
jgi:hypothetical protein